MKEVVYQGHDNLITFQLQDDHVTPDELGPAELGGVTRMTLEFDDTTIPTVDSDSHAGVFDWSAGNGYVDIRLGGQGLPEGSHRVTLIVYDNSNPNGIRWEPAFCILVTN